jgi:hypothetical protein
VTHIITTQDSPGGSIVGQHQLSFSSRSRVAATHLTRFRGVCFLATNHHASAVAPPKKNKCMFGWYVSCGFHQLPVATNQTAPQSRRSPQPGFYFRLDLVRLCLAAADFFSVSIRRERSPIVADISHLLPSPASRSELGLV